MSLEHSPSRMLDTKEVMRRTGWSRTTIWRKVRSGEFPAPFAIGPNSNRWTEELYAYWLGRQAKVSYAPADDQTEAREVAVVS